MTIVTRSVAGILTAAKASAPKATSHSGWLAKVVCVVMAVLVAPSGCDSRPPRQAEGTIPRRVVADSNPRHRTDRDAGRPRSGSATGRAVRMLTHPGSRDADGGDHRDGQSGGLSDGTKRTTGGEPADVRDPLPTLPIRRLSGWPRYRPPDHRPMHDDQRLAARGIHRFESKRLRLYTDIDPKIAKTLPAAIDQAYDAWEAYFGRLPPNRKGTAYQITGYVMADKKRFRRAGLLPADLPAFLNGRHRGAQFWINDQSSDYYRRHLLIHEGTHCFMTTGSYVVAPLWYMEGMAELFGTHRMDADGRITFRVMPRDPARFLNFGRIEMIQQDVRKGRMLSLKALNDIDPDEFLKNYPYAWSWALCKLLDTHPRYRDRFRQLGHDPARRRFQPEFLKRFADDLADMNTEWELFAAGLVYGDDIERAAIHFQPGRPLADSSESSRLELKTDRGWQSSRVLVEKGHAYRITATGRFHLADKPKPWISEPQGISFEYFEGRPLGMLLAAVRGPPKTIDREARESMLSVVPIGREKQFTAKQTGTLYFRVNDSWADLKDNSGSVRIEIRLIQ